jgi:23S rRNA (uracil1939-C5)-methyltransferase
VDGDLSNCFVVTRGRMRYIALVRKGETVTLTCSALDVEGAGVGQKDGLRVHVAGALPSEAVRATIAHVSPHRPDAWATLDRVESASPSRVAPVCPGFGQCGGCVIQHLAYEAQRTWKWERVANQIIGNPALQSVPVAPCVASPRPLGYRNRSKLVYARIGGKRVLGAYAPRTHVVVDMAGCKVAEAPLDEIARALTDVLDELNVEPYDEPTGAGELRYVILRVNHLQEVLVTLVTPHRDWPTGVKVAERLRALKREVVGVVQNVNPGKGNAIYGRENLPLDGRATLDDKVGSAFVRLSPTAFFQVNRDVATILYADLLAASGLTGTERVVDCYTGVGGVALTLASRAAEVIGIEENPSAVEDALASAHLNHANRTRFVCGDAAEKLGELDAADVIVLNPPRRGCAPAVLEATARLRPRLILYVSCSPETLVRDLGLLRQKGFVTHSVRPYDMLPQTPHVEALAVLTPQAG